MVLTLAAFVVPLGFDTLAVAVALGLRGLHPLRPALTFTFFEALMPIIGLLLGRLVGPFQEIGTLIGGAILLAVALHMLREASETTDETDGLSFTSLRTAVIAGFGVSMDELAVGFPMGTSGLPVPHVIGAIALQTLIVTYGGIVLGRHLGATLAHRTSRVAAFIAAGAFGLLGITLIVRPFLPGMTWP